MYENGRLTFKVRI